MKKGRKLLNEESNSSFELNNESIISMLLLEITSLRDELKKIPLALDKRIYTSKDVKELLGIKDKLLKKYRDDGLLTYHQVGDKYWYTQSDIDDFIEKNTYLAYNTM